MNPYVKSTISASSFFTKIKYKDGRTVKIKIIADVNPPTITVASGLWTSDPTPDARVAGISPSNASSIVISIGLS